MSDRGKTNDSLPKANGLGVDPMERLASFKPSRNLTLGGPKPNKKIFVPNLNVARNKTKSSSKTQEQKKEEKNKGERKNDRNRYNMRNGPNNKIIKSSGIFCEGPGQATPSPHRQSHGFGVDTTTLQRPVLRVKNVKAIDKELEEQKIKSMMASGTSEEYEDEVFKGAGRNEAPIKLPIDDGWTIPSTKPVQIKQEVVIKSELDDEVDVKPDIKPLAALKTEIFDNTDVVNLLYSDRPGLVLVKLPESLPGRGGSADDAESNGNNEDRPPNKCVLKNLAEGRIGKLLVHRSGRVTFALGNNELEVNLGKQSSFYQEVVSVGVDDRSRSARLVSLGTLRHKLVVVPNWETILKDVPS